MWFWQAGGMLCLGWFTNALLLSGYESAYLFLLCGGTSLYCYTWTGRLVSLSQVSPLERKIFGIWGVFVALSATSYAVGVLQDLALNRVFPYAILLCAFACGSMATVLGGSFYPAAFACAAAAIAVARYPMYGPGVFGRLFALGLLVPARKYSRATIRRRS